MTPPLPDWTKRDDLGGLVPSDIRASILQYAKDYHAAPSDERIMEVARRHWKLPGNDVIAFVRELLG